MIEKIWNYKNDGIYFKGDLMQYFDKILINYFYVIEEDIK